jgi:hypothetical protein
MRLIFLACLPLFMQAQTTVQTESFTAIAIHSHVQVTVKNDSIPAYQYEGPEMSPKPRVENGTLIVDGNRDVVVMAPAINKIVISGTGRVTTAQALRSETLQAEVSGSGKMDLRVEAVRVQGTVSGLGKIVFTGHAKETEFSVPGSGKIEAHDLQSEKSIVHISGLGKVTVNASDELTANISGNGSVLYKRKPQKLNINTTGTGTVNAMDEEYSMGIPDTTKLQFGKRELWIIGEKDSARTKHKKIKPIWAGFELGINSYMAGGGTFDLKPGMAHWELKPEKSVSVALNIIQQDIELGRSNVWLMTGLGIAWNNYRFEKDVVVQNGDYIRAVKDTTAGVRHLKSKLTASYLTAPVMLQVFTSRNMKRAFHLTAGAMLGMRLGSHSKRKVEIDGDGAKLKEYDDHNLDPFRYGFRVMAGYGRFNLFADYYALTLFRKNKGPVLYPVNAGITVVGF